MDISEHNCDVFCFPYQICAINYAKCLFGLSVKIDSFYKTIDESDGAEVWLFQTKFVILCCLRTVRTTFIRNYIN